MGILFGKPNADKGSVSAPTEQYNVQPTLEGMMAINLSAVEESYKLEAGMYVADAMMESSVLEGANVAPVMEAFVGNVFQKLKAIWNKLWGKLRSWFEAVKKRLQLMTTKGEKFISQFEKELKEKSKVGFKYQGYKWDMDAFVTATTKIDDALAAGFEEKFVNVDSLLKAASRQETLAAELDKAKKYEDNKEDNGDALLEKAFGTHGATASEVSTNLVKLAHGGEAKAEIENFSVLSVDQMIDIVKGGKTAIAKIERIRSDFDKKFSDVIKAINTASTKLVGGMEKGEDQSNESFNKEHGAATAYFKKLTSILQKVVNTRSQLLALTITVTEEVARESESTLKAFLRYKAKPTKESATGLDLDNEPESLLEAAIRLV